MVFEPIIVTIDCIIEEIQKPTPLVNTIYHILAAAQSYSLTPEFTQWPPCGYNLVETITWELDGVLISEVAGSPITAPDDYTITIESDTMSDHGIYTLVVTNEVTYEDDTVGSQSWTESITFDVELKDPCKTSAIQAINIDDITVTVGGVAEFEFSEAVDSAEQTYGVDSCGARQYTIVDQSDVSAVIPYATVVEVVPYQTFKIVTADESVLLYNEGVHNLALYTTMINYPTSEEASHPTY